MSFWNSIRIGASGLSAQRLRLDVISNNIANAQTTKTEDGGPYQRQDVVFSPQDSNTFLPTFLANRLQGTPAARAVAEGGVQVTQVVTDETPGAQVYDPTHPDADENGYVTYPNVDLVVEMTNMLSATRSYEANLAAVEAAKRMALKALDIGS
ncbi:MAG: flagellar basal body rod protein FlgC [Chloroflexi bacterium]|nr:flagellar basal body rod protein FlgC [Anaerolineaceae bacterium]NMB90647.1 flagellar basal body rod protein FlgC [Chloroflexota bacterium]